MSSMRVGPVGVQPSSSRVPVLVASRSMAKKLPIQPKWSWTSSAAIEATGRSNARPDAAGTGEDLQRNENPRLASSGEVKLVLWRLVSAGSGSGAGRLASRPGAGDPAGG